MKSGGLDRSKVRIKQIVFLDRTPKPKDNNFVTSSRLENIIFGNV